MVRGVKRAAQGRKLRLPPGADDRNAPLIEVATRKVRGVILGRRGFGRVSLGRPVDYAEPL